MVHDQDGELGGFCAWRAGSEDQRMTAAGRRRRPAGRRPPGSPPSTVRELAAAALERWSPAGRRRLGRNWRRRSARAAPPCPFRRPFRHPSRCSSRCDHRRRCGGRPSLAGGPGGRAGLGAWQRSLAVLIMVAVTWSWARLPVRRRRADSGAPWLRAARKAWTVSPSIGGARPKYRWSRSLPRLGAEPFDRARYTAALATLRAHHDALQARISWSTPWVKPGPAPSRGPPSPLVAAFR